MGWNTSVLILNDAVHGIDDDPKRFADSLRQAMGEFHRSHEPVDFPIGNHVNGATVFHQSHADNVGVYAIGGNHTSKLLETYNGGRHYTPDDRVALLKQIADELGYRIVKKSGSS